jgi:hypothetical protein
MSLVEGLVLIFEKQLASQYERKVDVVKVVEGVVPGGVTLVDANPELTKRIVTQHTSVLGLRERIKDRTRVFAEQLSKFEPEVLDHISQIENQACIIQDKEATCTIKIQVVGAGGAGAGAGAGAGTSTKPGGKKDVMDHLQVCMRRALMDLGVNPDRPYDPRMATHVLSHVQFTPLVNHYYTSTAAVARAPPPTTSRSPSTKSKLKTIVKFAK